MNTPTSLTIPPGVMLLQHGAELPENLSWEDWRTLLTGLKRVKGAYHNILGDALAFGRSKWGDKADEAIEQMEFDLGDVQRAEASSKFSLMDRNGLSTDQLHVIAKEAEPSDRQRWAREAVEHELTPRELQHSIRQGKVIRQDEIHSVSGRGSSLPTLASVASAFSRWERAVGGVEGVSKLNVNERNYILEELEPIWAFISDLDEREEANAKAN